MAFAPIAIVGQGCVLPQAASPQELWRLVVDRRDALRPAPAEYWHHATLDGLTHPEDPPLPHLLSGRGGYIDGFAGLFDAQGFHLPAESILELDALFQWLLYAGRDALRSAGHDTRTRSPRAGAIVGNLSYPTPAMVAFAERVWWNRAPEGARAVDPRNRFCSGLPAHTLAGALGLGAAAFALDAACASSLYAIKLACDWLHDRRADLMLAGGVNGADGFIIHGGFSVLQAISPTGRSRPFHRQADGLVPAEGAALVALKRLEDAETAGDRILGVIRGVGLSNDGRGQGFLAPSEAGQARAMCDAYACAGLSPTDVSFVECHATGTPVGDAVEIRSMMQVFGGAKDLPIGSLKSNLGHLITAAGAAGLLKVLAAMDAGIRPPNAHADAPIAALASSPFRLLDAPEPWESDGPRRAGLSAFGFGGNNAHLIVEEWHRASRPRAAPPPPALTSDAQDVAITAVGVRIGECTGHGNFARALLAGHSLLEARADGTSAAQARTIELDFATLRFPPNDLRGALPQQLLILETSQQIAADVARLPGDRTGVFVGMQCDAEGARIAARCRVPHRIAELDGVSVSNASDGWLDDAYAAVSPPLTPAGVLGAMANIVANRLHSCFDLKGPGFAASAEELSGLMALDAGARAVSRGELDAAIVGAVDLSCEPVHEAAVSALLPPPYRPPADAAVLLILKRLADARRDGDTIYAVLPAQPGPHADVELGPYAGASNVLSGMGHAHAASGLLHVTAAALACYHRAVPMPDAPAVPWLPHTGGRAAAVSVKAFSGPTHQTFLRPEPGICPAPPFAVPELRVYAADSRDGLLRALEHDAPGDHGSLRLAVVSGDARSFPALREEALAALRGHRGTPQRLCELADGVYLGEVAPTGDLGFVFTGPAGAYRQMGRELLIAMPELADGVFARFEGMGKGAGWLYGGDAAGDPAALDKLWAASFLSQVHAELTRGLLGLVPHAAIGFCSGETNALLALGAWTDMGGMYEGLAACRLFSPDDWASWRILAPVGEVRRALMDEPRVHLTIVSSPDDVVIAGDDACCRRVVDAIGARRAHPLNYNVVMHCPEAAAFADTWRALHHRATTPPPGVRFYTHATGSAYELSADAVAERLTQQAMSPVDFPRLIERAWQDGVRVFVEHGPLAGCSKWIRQTLGTREHVAVALDRFAGSSLLGAADAVARLAAAGVPVNHAAFVRRLHPDAPPPPRAAAAASRFAGHWQPVRMPSVPDTTSHDVAEPAQTMEPAPWLPPVSEEWVPEERIGHVPATAAARADSPATVVGQIAAHHARVTALHQEFLRQQAEVQQRFLQVVQTMPAKLFPATASLETPPVVQPAATPEPAAGAPRGPQFSREQLKIHASGRISTLFGPAFAGQDRFHLQVRLPEEPLLLVDRVTGIDAEPGSMQRGTLWTETDVRWDSWYLHHGRMPAGITVEAGQADLMLISWLGVDGVNQGQRVYRLLGCEGTFHGELPRPGETLCYDIHVDGYARQGDVLLFFFHYDCRVNGELRLSVRNGQAGFFTAPELQDSQGVLWDPADVQLQANARLDGPSVSVRRDRFTAEQVRAFSEGRVLECFGPGFERAETHTRTPRIMSGAMCLLGEVETFDPAGGPWGRGYLRSVTNLAPDDWFFQGHFKNDPCMPGTLMFQACVQAMEFYLTAMGYTLERDGWRFEPVTDQSYTLKCRGQATPSSRQLVYEIFVEELVAGPIPTVFADMLCTVDGLKAFHGRRIGLRLVPDWPLESDRERHQAVTRYEEPKPIARVGTFDFGYRSLLACALGRPSNAFGELYRAFDGPRRVARLPGPPYHFMSRVCTIDAVAGGVQEGGSIEVEYDVPADAWYFEDNGARVMPFAVLVEVALQPCGWLASYVGCALTTSEDLYFRNLDGTATTFMEVGPDTGTLSTRSTLTSISQAAGTILVAFDVDVRAGDRQVAHLDTTFGFFTAAALAHQTGIPSLLAQQPADGDAGVHIDLTARPARYFDGPARLPGGKLLMIDRVTGYWPQGGKAGLGRARAEKTIDPSAWFFKAHFFQDPVQPGTLGLEAMLQLLQFVMLHGECAAGVPGPRFEPVALNLAVTWKYRGQVLPENRTVVVDLELVKITRDADGVVAVADASLWVDGTPIYQVTGLGMRIVAGERAVSSALTIDTDDVRRYWRSTVGLDHGCLSEDVFIALLEKYVGRVVLEDPDALMGLRGRSALFLANHQVGVETAVLMILVSYLSRSEVHVLAKAEHRSGWLADLLAFMFSYPGMRQMRNVIYLDRSDLRAAAATLEGLKRDFFSHPRSLIVHVEGTRSLTCRQPVTKISALLLDLAVELDVPIVPLRMAGGLPVTEAAERLMFPLEHGSQDYYVGRPVSPDALRRAPYAERKQLVADAINGLGPSPSREEPNPGEPAFSAAVDAWHRTTGASPECAALLTALQRLREPCAQTRAVLEGASRGSLAVGDDAYGRWLGPIARLLYGPRGPHVRDVE